MALTEPGTGRIPAIGIPASPRRAWMRSPSGHIFVIVPGKALSVLTAYSTTTSLNPTHKALVRAEDNLLRCRAPSEILFLPCRSQVRLDEARGQGEFHSGCILIE